MYFGQNLSIYLFHGNETQAAAELQSHHYTRVLSRTLIHPQLFLLMILIQRIQARTSPFISFSYRNKFDARHPFFSSVQINSLSPTASDTSSLQPSQDGEIQRSQTWSRQGQVLESSIRLIQKGSHRSFGRAYQMFNSFSFSSNSKLKIRFRYSYNTSA